MPSKRIPALPYTTLALFILLSLSAGLIGSQFPPGEWYAALARPAWNPPDWVFAPVWTTLYCLMGISAWLVWRRSGWREAAGALGLFFLQLAFNALWSWLFFGLHRMDIALAEILVLAATIAATAWSFWRHSRTAAWLLLPYLAWVLFATVLNATLWQLNAA